MVPLNLFNQVMNFSGSTGPTGKQGKQGKDGISGEPGLVGSPGPDAMVCLLMRLFYSL